MFGRGGRRGAITLRAVVSGTTRILGSKASNRLSTDQDKASVVLFGFGIGQASSKDIKRLPFDGDLVQSEVGGVKLDIFKPEDNPLHLTAQKGLPESVCRCCQPLGSGLFHGGVVRGDA